MNTRPAFNDNNQPIGTLFCIGRNYAEHAKELNNAIPESPVVFLKPSSAIVFDGDTVTLPDESHDVHHEAELVARIGKTAHQVSEKEALRFIDAYTIGIDFTARDIQTRAKTKGLPWSLAKGFDTFAPLGNMIPAQHIEHPDQLALRLSVNGTIRQNGSTSDMIFSVPAIISYLSHRFTLYPGDLIFTGTPSGVSRVSPGDQVKAELVDQHATLTISIR